MPITCVLTLEKDNARLAQFQNVCKRKHIFSNIFTNFIYFEYISCVTIISKILTSNIYQYYILVLDYWLSGRFTSANRSETLPTNPAPLTKELQESHFWYNGQVPYGLPPHTVEYLSNKCCRSPSFDTESNLKRTEKSSLQPKNGKSGFQTGKLPQLAFGTRRYWQR